MKKRIIFITPTIKTGGGNRVFFELANILCHSYDIMIVYPNNSDEANTFHLEPEVRLHVIGKRAKEKWTKLYNLFRLIRYINRNHQQDIIIYTDPIFSIFAAKGIKVPQSYRFIQADDYRIFDDGMVLGKGLILRLYKRLCLWAYQKQHIHYLFNSHYTYERYLQDSGCHKVPYLLIHPAINHDIFRIKQRLQTETPKPSICLVARKHPSKGLDTFIQAFQSLPPEVLSQCGPIKLISHDNLSAFKTQGMEIIRPKSDNDIADVYNISDIFISTSWREGFGLPPLEAMACGCACIISRSGGVDEYAIDLQNCLMFEPKDVLNLQTLMMTLIQDSTLRQQLSRTSLSTSKLFSWEKSAKQLIDILNKN